MSDMEIYFFYADWCGPCQRSKPEIDNFIDEHPDIKVHKINVDDDLQMAKDYEIKSIPTLIYFKDGEEVERHGSCTKDQIVSKLNEF